MAPLVDMMILYIGQLVDNAIEERFHSFSAQREIPITEKEIMTRKDVKEFLQISFPTLRTWIKQGKIPSYKKGGRLYFIKEEIIASLKKADYSHYKR